MNSVFEFKDNDANFNVIHTNQFRRLNLYKNLFSKKISSGPNEVFKNFSKSKTGNVTILRDQNDRNLNIEEKFIIIGDFLYQVPQSIKNSIKNKQVLIGPNIDFSLENNLIELRQYKNPTLVVPSKWVKDLWEDQLANEKYRLIIWAAGVDVKYWKTSKKNRDKVLIYIKFNSDLRLIQKYKDLLYDLGIKYSVIEYGKYNQRRFRRILQESMFCIWFGTTESQGIAQFQCWSSGVPTFVLKKDQINWKGKFYPSSSSPYLCDETGRFFSEFEDELNNVKFWLDMYKNLNPRQWIENNFTYEKAELQIISQFNN